MTSGKVALVVEAEFLIALDMQRLLETLGFTETVLARHADEAFELSPHWSRVSLALVEIRLDDVRVVELVSALRRQGVPVVAITSDVDLSRGHPALPGIAVLSKPVPEGELVDAIHLGLGGDR